MRQIAVIAVLCLGPLFLTVAAPAWAEGPSFDCAKAATPVEKAICASGDLSALDRQIADEYQAALSLKQTTIAEQREWLTRRNTACAPDNTADCLRQVMMDRHSFLTRRPKGYVQPTFQGHPSFDCDLARRVTEKAICGNKKLVELDLALMSAYEAARRENFRISADSSEWPNEREETCADAEDADNVRECVARAMSNRIENLSRRSEFDETLQAVRSYKTLYPTAPIDSEVEVSRLTTMLGQSEAFRSSGAKVENCGQMISLLKKGPTGYTAYGTLCTVGREGKKARELICFANLDVGFEHLDIADRPIGRREVAIFTYENCINWFH